MVNQVFVDVVSWLLFLYYSSRMFDQAQYSPSGSSTMPKGVIEGHRLKTRVNGSNVNEYQNHGNPGYRTRYNAAASNGESYPNL